jgi:hypothetical protein
VASKTPGSRAKLAAKYCQEKHEDQPLKLPNVVGVAIGAKVVKGQVVPGREVIKGLFVTRKVPESQLNPDQTIPKTLEGYETDVEEVGIITTQVA